MKKSYSKLILMGEHSAVYKKLAIAIPFKKVYTIAKAKYIKDEKHFISSNFYNGYINDNIENLEGIHHLINLFTNKYNVKSKIKLKIKSTIPVKKGLGSSASVSYAITKALFKLVNIKPGIKEFIYYITESEKKYHTNPSGIDMYTILNENIITLENNILSKIDLKLEGYLLVIDTNISSKTSDSVLKIRNNYELNINNAKENISKLDKYAKKFLLLAKYKNYSQMGLMMYKAQNTLKDLGVSSKEIDFIVNIAKTNNALGAKLTGGGQGGCVIIYDINKKVINNIKKELKQKGIKKIWTQKL